MQPSSLIFLVVIAIWAAYLLQHWLKRREHLSTARSVDRFSESMRVLERRKAMPETDLSKTPARTYAVSPARLHRPEVTVKRADSAVAAESVAGKRQTAAAAVRSAATSAVRSATATARAAAPAGRASAASAPAATDRATGRPATAASGKPLLFGRAPRGVLFVAALVATIGSLLLAKFGVVGATIPIVMILLTAGSFVFLRRAVAADLAARRRAARPGVASAAPVARNAQTRTSAQTRVPGKAPAGVPTRTAATLSTPASATRAGRTPQRVTERPTEQRPARETVEAEPALAPTAERAPFDVEAHRAAPAATATEAPAQAGGIPQSSAEPDIDRGWSPVPVPRPTYTMKAKAVYPAPLGVIEDEDDDVVNPFASAGESRERASRFASG